MTTTRDSRDGLHGGDTGGSGEAVPRSRGVDVTLVVIAHNEAARIGRCLQSLVAQTYTGTYEVVVVDDGSTDDTARIADGFGPPVRVSVLPDNRGRGAARRHGIETARGKIVGFVDADIEVGGDWLERCVDALPGCAAAGGIAVPDGDVAPLARVSGATVRPVRGSMPVTGNNVVFDGAVLRAHGFDPDAKLGEDFRLAARLLAAGHVLRTVEDLHVRHHETKSYRRSLSWLHQSGVDATGLLREYRRWRLPDLAWIGTVAATTIGAVLAPWHTGFLLSGPAAVALVSIVHTCTRFRPRPLARFLLALVLNLPLTAAYLAGRTRGVFAS